MPDFSLTPGLAAQAGDYTITIEAGGMATHLITVKDTRLAPRPNEPVPPAPEVTLRAVTLSGGVQVEGVQVDFDPERVTPTEAGVPVRMIVQIKRGLINGVKPGRYLLTVEGRGGGRPSAFG